MFNRLLGFTLVCALTSLALAGCECDNPPDLDASVDGALPDGALPDGAMPDGGPPPGPVITICPGDALPPPASGICEATAGDANLLITGDVLTPGEVFRGGQVLVDGSGAITCVGCDCSGEAGASGATTVVCPDAVVSPGLINAHEHITFQAFPWAGTAERYEHRHDWRTSAPARGHNEIPTGSDINTESWDELREAMAGVTSMNGSGSVRGMIRNLDVGTALEGLSVPDALYDTFPLDDDRVVDTGCDAYSTGRVSNADIATENAYTPHMAEGIDRGARNEFLCQSEGDYDLIEPQTAVIHGIGLLAPDIALMAQEQTSLIWSPRSNIALYGETARVTLYDNLGVLIAMGTDWQRSGSMNMLRELQCADELNATYMGGHFSDEQLWLMATYNGAVATGMEGVIGTLAPGMIADIAIFSAATNPDHRAVIDAQPEDVALVLRGGRVLFGEQAVVSTLDSGCDAIDVCGAPRAACVQRELGVSLGALRGMNPDGTAYPLFFCGGVTPDTEPTCLPARDAMGTLPSPEVDGSNRYTGIVSAEDMDGDGIANATDLCPTIFNPIRPLDMGAQADFDDDGLGDECDPCPLDADTTVCTPVDPNDRDRDTITDTVDNCPGVANTDQADSDMDGVGDACDACPDAPNPGGAACPATIYDVKDGTITVGGRVRITRSVVTSVGGNGLTMQVPTDHPDYAGVDFSGIFVFTGGTNALSDGTPITVGMTVDAEGATSDFFGQTQLSLPTLTASATSSSLPAATVATPAQLDTGGARAAALEGVLVRVESVAVSNVAPPPSRTGSDSMGEFEIAGSLRVDDLLYLIDPFVTASENFTSITGVMLYRNTRHKLHPRGAMDYVAGSPQLAAISPALTYARAGAGAGSTFPEVLTVRLTRPPGTATTVTVTSGSPSNLMVSNVMVPAGSLSAPVPVTGVTAGTYTISATLGSDTFMADVRVLGATEAPATFTLSPTSTMVGAGSSQTFTVTLDIPAPPGGTRVDLVETTSGTVPAMITVPANALEQTFTYTAPAAATTGMLTATLFGTAVNQVASITVLPPRPGTLVINEVDYDQAGTDSMEYVELYNPGTTAVSLAGKQLLLVNGSGGAVYDTIDLSMAGTELAAGGYLVVRASTVTVASGALTIDFSGATNLVQNGPDGVAVWDSTAMTLIDALSYEGSVTNAAIGGMTLSLVEGTVSPLADNNTGVGSFSRIPNGSDTDDAATDWAFSTCLTPGAANMSCP